jgi:hypothetical protein
MRLLKAFITCAAIGAIASVPAAAQSTSAAKPNGMQDSKSSKMTAPDSGDKEAMSKKTGMGMKDSAGMSKSAMKSDKAPKADKAMMDEKSKGMTKPKAARDTGMTKHDHP